MQKNDFVNENGLIMGDELSNMMYEVRYSFESGSKMNLILQVIEKLKNVRHVQEQCRRLEYELLDVKIDDTNRAEIQKKKEQNQVQKDFISTQGFFLQRWDFLLYIWGEMQKKYKDGAGGVLKKYIDAMISNKVNSASETYKQKSLVFYI